VQLEGSDTPVQAEADDQGEFRITVPAAGSYRITASAREFKPMTAEAVVTDQAPAATVDLTLVIATVSETVQVTVDALTTETTSTQMGEMMETKKIVSVPLNGRNFTDLMAVQPGIIPVNTAQPGAVIMTGVASTSPSAGSARPRMVSA
jgi:hypothetical protein